MSLRAAGSGVAGAGAGSAGSVADRPGAARGASRSPPQGDGACGGKRRGRPSQALAAQGAAARQAYAHAHPAAAPRAAPGPGRRRRRRHGARGPAQGRVPGPPGAAGGRGRRSGARLVSTHPPGPPHGPRSDGGRPPAPRPRRAGRGRARAPPPRADVERGLSRRSGCWWSASCWRWRRAGPQAP